jgi:diguanylate cyclase (GGDEF)-like protein
MNSPPALKLAGYRLEEVPADSHTCPSQVGSRAPVPEAMQERERLECLERLDILDSGEEASFDRITRLVRRIFDVPMSTITFVDGHRQWFKAQSGMATRATDRDPSLCYYAVRQRQPLVIPDTLLDPRFSQTRFVVGAPHVRFYAGFPVFGADRVCVGTLCAMDTKPHDFTVGDGDIMTALAETVSDLLEFRSLATTDPLTGISNRRGFLGEAARALALSSRYGHDLSLIVIDIDHFKKVNDTYGHSWGDAVLARTARTCEAVLRKTDALGRLGGEEFAVLLPFTNHSAAMAMAEDLRAAISSMEFDFPAGKARVTASCGIASAATGLSDFEELLQTADAALYRAKDAGRNCCKSSNPALHASGGRRVLKGGKIVFNKGMSVIDCTVRRLSDSTAVLDVISSASVPDAFKLRVDCDGLSRMCRIARKAGERIEVVFS